MGKHYYYIYVEPDGSLFNHAGKEIVVIDAELLKILLDKYCIACQNIHDSYDHDPCKSCKEGRVMFTLHDDFKMKW